MAEFQAGWAALAHIDRAIADRPRRDGVTLTSAVQALAEFRDHFIARHRGDGGTRWRPALERVNAVVSVVMAAEFPVGEVPWDELCKGRAWLDAVLREESARSL